MPARLRDIVRALRSLGISVVESRKGSHWKAVGAGGRVLPIPAHNGSKSEIDDRYIGALCEAFDLDEKAFRKEL